jgi:hypothetical protein
MAIGPSGWTRTTTTRVKSPACSVDTTEGSWSEWRDSNPHLKAWGARWLPLPTHSLWFGLRVSNPSLRAGDAGCCLHTQAERGTGVVHRPIDVPSVVKDPALASLVGGKGFEPKRSRGGERGYGPSADHPHVPPVWRQRQDSNPDPRALEARMLPLHHAAAVTSRLDRFEDRTSPRPGGVFPLDARPKQKRPSRGSP